MGIRCQNPACRKKIAEALEGSLILTCPRCKLVNVIKVDTPRVAYIV